MVFFVLYCPIRKKYVSVRPPNSALGGKKTFDAAQIGQWPSSHVTTIDRDFYSPHYYPAAIARKEAHESVNRHGIATLRRPDYEIDVDINEVHYFRKQTPFVEYTPEYKQFFYTRRELVAFINEVYRTSVETLGWEIWTLNGEPVSTTTTVMVIPSAPAVEIFTE